MTSPDTTADTSDDPLYTLVEDLRDWFRDGGFIAGVHYDEASMLQQIEEVLGTARPHADNQTGDM